MIFSGPDTDDYTTHHTTPTQPAKGYHTVTHKPQNERDNWPAAAKIKARHTASVEHIRGRRDLSDAGRKRQLAVATKTARDRLAALEHDDRQRQTDRVATLEAALFTPPGRTAVEAMNARDASARAASITTLAEATAMARRAHRDRDHVLSAAIARHAIDIAAGGALGGGGWWSDIVHPWAQTVPGAPERLAELGEIEHENGDTMARTNRGITYQPAAVPELRGENVDALAAAADDQLDLRPPTHAEQVGAQLAAGASGDWE